MFRFRKVRNNYSRAVHDPGRRYAFVPSRIFVDDHSLLEFELNHIYCNKFIPPSKWAALTSPRRVFPYLTTRWCHLTNQLLERGTKACLVGFETAILVFNCFLRGFGNSPFVGGDPNLSSPFLFQTVFFWVLYR